jgi:hypothetical protein
MHYFTARIIIFLFLYLHYKKYRMRPTSKWEVSLQENYKISYIKKEDSSKIGQYRVNLISRIEFVSLVLYKFLPDTHM